MKIKIKRIVLLESLNKVIKATSSQNPILAGIKFEVEKDKIILIAANNEITIKDEIEVEEDNLIIEREGKTVISGKYILDIVKKIDANDINIEVLDDLKIIVYTQNSEFNLNAISLNDFGNINIKTNKEFIKLNAKDFKKTVNQISYATSNDESRMILTGINFVINKNKKIEVSATDSYRLARKIIGYKNEIENEYNITIPSRNLIEFIRIINDEDDIEMFLFENKVIFKSSKLIFQSRLINGNYPNTEKLFPKSSDLILTMDMDNIYNAIDRASIFTSDKENNVVTIETNKDLLMIRSQDVEIGRVEEKLVVNKNNDIDIKTSFSAKFMLDALKATGAEKINLEFINETKPIIIKSEEESDLYQLVLPIRTY